MSAEFPRPIDADLTGFDFHSLLDITNKLVLAMGMADGWGSLSGPYPKWKRELEEMIPPAGANLTIYPNSDVELLAPEVFLRLHDALKCTDFLETRDTFRRVVPTLEEICAQLPKGNGSSGFTDPEEEPAKHGGRRVSEETFAKRELIEERWVRFGDIYKDRYTRRSIENFTEWACEEFDDMPSDDPEEIRRMRQAHRKTPRPSPKKAPDR